MRSVRRVHDRYASVVDEVGPMTRTAALDGIERFVDDAVEATREEFRVARALRGTGFGPGGAVIDRLRKNATALERRVVEPELAEYRRRSIEQLEILLDAVDEGTPVNAVRSDLIAADSYLDSLDPDVDEATRSAVVDDVLVRLERLGEALAPIVSHPADEFWPAVHGVYDRDAAVSLVEQRFPFTAILRRHRDAFAFTVAIDPGSVLGSTLARTLPSVSIEYTDEAIRAMRQAESRVVHETTRDVHRRYDERDCGE